MENITCETCLVFPVCKSRCERSSVTFYRIVNECPHLQKRLSVMFSDSCSFTCKYGVKSKDLLPTLDLFGLTIDEKIGNIIKLKKD